MVVAGEGVADSVPEPVAISVVTIGELRAGVLRARDSSQRAQRTSRLDAIRSTFEPLPVDEHVATRYGELLAWARDRGRSEKATDLLIAATAAATDRGLYTLDRRQANLAKGVELTSELLSPREGSTAEVRAGRRDREAGSVELRPLRSGDEEELLRIHRRPEVARWWDEPEAGFPWDEPDATRFTILADGAIAGLIQYGEEPEPKYRHTSIDLFVDPALHGRGIGSEALRQLVRRLIDERGHHRITIDPALANEAAIRAYERVGFRRVGVMRQAERDADGRGWHDSLLMELLAGEETEPSG